jgi:DNA-binding NarL/FixJ family response regulator
VSGRTVVGLLHADGGPTGRSLRFVDRTFIGMFADAVGVIHERGLLGETTEQLQRSAAALGEGVVRCAEEITTNPPTGRDLELPQIGRLMKFGGAPKLAPNRLTVLTNRERQVLALLASGATNAELADQLTVAESTVKSHVKHILRKLGASNRSTAIAMYLRETHERQRGFH